MRYAIIVGGIVQNVIIADFAEASKLALLVEGLVVNVDQYPVDVGYSYTDHVFYDLEGNRVDRIPTEREMILIQEIQSNERDDYLIDLDFRLSLIELGV